ncbi:MAG: methyl-accepting chemotaxis protein, partial [Gemmatimonadaceae bacterium]|nr:methyl-accepting chemotaxis protein [Gemmatimonadaceae bacterium]
SPRRPRAALPFRWKLAATSSAVVLATVLVLLVPVYVQTRQDVTQLQGQRLLAVARSAAALLDPADLDSVAALPEGPAFDRVRATLSRVWIANGGSGEDLSGGLFVVRPSGVTQRIVAHSQWAAGRADYTKPWEVPPSIEGLLSRGTAGVSSLYAATGGQRLTAIAPVPRRDGPVPGFVVTTLRADSFLGEVQVQVLRFAAFLPILLGLAVGVSFSIAGRLTKGIEAVARHAEDVASGSLRRDVAYVSDDEVGQLADAFRRMTGSLRALLREVEANAGEVAATAEQLAAGAQQMTASTQEVSGAASRIAEAAATQTHGIASIAAASQRVAERAQANARNAQAALEVAERVQASVGKGTSNADQALTSMAAIAEVTRNAVPAVEALADKSRRIGKITDSIGAIAKQTNLLALNASIEAARAGEHGKGFAVVADEVRKLAAESARALEQIRALAAEIRAAAQATGESIGTMADRVDAGERVIRASAEALARIGGEMAGSREAVARIVDAANAQQAEATGLVTSIDSIARSAEENAGTSQQVSAVVEEQGASMQHVTESSQHLADIANRLKGALTRFDL